jgi:dihydroflavonol-4-reductase
VGEAIVGAAERNKGGNAYPIGYYNLTWDDFLHIVHKAMGQPDRKIIHIQKWMFKAYGIHMKKEYKKRNVESGIDAKELAEIMCMNTFIDKKWCVELGVAEDDINSAIFDSVKLSVDAFTGKQKLLEMKGE